MSEEKQILDGVSGTISEDTIEWEGALHGFPLYLGAFAYGTICATELYIC